MLAVIVVGVVLVGMVVRLGVPIGHALGPLQCEPEMAVRPAVGMAVDPAAVPVGVLIGTVGGV